jgi:hypothetical protein
MAWLQEEPSVEEAFYRDLECLPGDDIKSAWVAFADIVAREHVVYMSGCDGACPWYTDWPDDDDDEDAP